LKPVDQRIIDPKIGDCMTACIASLLELPYEDVPHFTGIEAKGGRWFHAMLGFLRRKGYQFMGTYSTNEPPLILGQELAERCPGVGGLYMAGGPSPRLNCSHAVLIDAWGKVVHDPHPSRLGVLSITHVNMIEKAV
jgi:hypothetical protein